MKLAMDAVIFAGGKSSRMGEDKALLPFGAYPTLAQYQYQKLQKYFKTVYLSCKENKFDFSCRVIRDTQETSSPLVGLLSFFETLDVEEVFVLSVDTPFIRQETIEKLWKQRDKEIDIVIAKSPSGLQPLCGFYKKTILPYAKLQVQKNHHKLHELLDLCQTKHVMFEDDEAFTNLNYKEEYQKALSKTILY